MEPVTVKIISASGMYPAYATAGAAGMDVMAYVSQPVVVEPGARVLVPTGLRVALPEGFELQLRPRSGLALKKGITLLNTPGTIDSDYRGEIGVILANLGTEAFTINNGDRIAQAVLARHERIVWQPETSLDNTDRGEGGFGHTGI